MLIDTEVLRYYAIVIGCMKRMRMVAEHFDDLSYFNIDTEGIATIARKVAIEIQKDESLKVIVQWASEPQVVEHVPHMGEKAEAILKAKAAGKSYREIAGQLDDQDDPEAVRKQFKRACKNGSKILDEMDRLANDIEWAKKHARKYLKSTPRTKKNVRPDK